ncbi:MAG: sulfite exporter TauE/SafE family protein [Lautropia sp.]
MIWIGAIAVAGFLIGVTGIGGVLVVPVLHELRDVDFRAAIAAASLAFGLPGVLALWRMRSERGALSRDALLLIGSTIPGALFGGLVVYGADVRWLLGGLGVATLLSGVLGLRGRDAARSAPPMPAALACTAGCAVGFGSAVTGTGGPVILWPVMLAARQELRRSLLIAQAVQLPIAVCASAIHLAAGGIDLRLSAGVGAILLIGVLAGQTAAAFLSASLLRGAVCGLLIATGAFYLYRAALS